MTWARSTTRREPPGCWPASALDGRHDSHRLPAWAGAGAGGRGRSRGAAHTTTRSPPLPLLSSRPLALLSSHPLALLSSHPLALGLGLAQLELVGQECQLPLTRDLLHLGLAGQRLQCLLGLLEHRIHHRQLLQGFLAPCHEKRAPGNALPLWILRLRHRASKPRHLAQLHHVKLELIAVELLVVHLEHSKYGSSIDSGEGYWLLE